MQLMWCWFALACVGSKGSGSSHSPDTGTVQGPSPDDDHPDGGFDTADTSSDSLDTGDEQPLAMLQPSALWVSADQGFGTGVGFADIDGDDALDLVVAYGNDMTPGPLVVYHNTEHALPSMPTWTSATTEYHGHLVVGDVNQDGWPDVAVSRFLGEAGFDQPGGVDVYLNHGGTLAETPSWSSDGFFTFALDLGDMDGDGALDLAVAVGEAYYNEPDVSLVFVNDGFGDFGTTPAWSSDVPRFSFDVAWADLLGDARLDLVLANQAHGHVIFENTDGMLAAEPAWTASGPVTDFEGNTLDVGDVSGDGYNDLVVSDNLQLGGVGRVRMWCGPVFELCWTSEDEPAYQSAVSLFDVDSDGDLDLMAGAWWGSVRMYENVEGMLWGTPNWQSDLDEIVVEGFAWGDVDGDSHPELAVTDWTETGGNQLYGR